MVKVEMGKVEEVEVPVEVPVYKKGSKSKACNYRPISLTCIASKLLEHILVSNIMSPFDDNNLLSQYQHGFRSEHSFTQEVYMTTLNIVIKQI